MEEIKADLHFHGPWQLYKENPREGSRTLEEFAKHLFAPPLSEHASSGAYLIDVLASTNFVAGEAMEVVDGKQGFFHRFLLPTAKETLDYYFEVKDNGFNVEVHKKETGKRRVITLTQEIQTSQGHLLAVGAYQHLTPFETAEDTCQEIIDAGGIAIPDHCLVLGGIGERLVRKLADGEYSQQRLISALEWNTNLPWPLSRSNKKVRELAMELGLPVIANSDGHSWKDLGTYTAYCTLGEPVATDAIRQSIEDSQIPCYHLNPTDSLPRFILHVIKTKLLSSEK